MAGNAERTYLMIKPDGVQRGLVGKIVMRFEERGYKLVSSLLLPPGLRAAAAGAAPRLPPPPRTAPAAAAAQRRARPATAPLTARCPARAGRDEVLRAVARAHGEALR